MSLTSCADPVDLVISDLRLPGIDGLTLAKALYVKRAIPILLISATFQHDMTERAAGDHVMAYLVEPIKRGEPLSRNAEEAKLRLPRQFRFSTIEVREIVLPQVA